jgi:hypothetical protein
MSCVDLAKIQSKADDKQNDISTPSIVLILPNAAVGQKTK